MKDPADATMYEYPLACTWDRFADHLSGDESGLFLAISDTPLSNRARTALASSAERLGFGEASGTFLTLRADASADRAHLLDAPELFEAVEGLDPIAVVGADKAAANALAEAYRTKIVFSKALHLFGRSFVAFLSFEDMLDSDREKQQAWALLKTLVH